MPPVRFAVAALCLSAAAALPVPPAAHAQTQELRQRATSAREIEDLGAYSKATDLLRELRGRTAPDADLEITLAMNEARSGQLDSAAARLWGPLLSEALTDTSSYDHRAHYFWSREQQWLDGKFDGWYWYVARARAEVAADLGRWSDAYEAARACTGAHPMSGKDWLVRAVCAAKAGQHDDAKTSAFEALTLDPTLPEPHYLLGLYAWRDGHRSVARNAFREAMRRDSAWALPAIARVRSQLPAARPDSLPGWLMTGVRRVALLTSSDGPKAEHFRQMETPAVLLRKAEPSFPPDMVLEGNPPPIVLTVLLDERGRPVLHELPWIPRGHMPDAWIAAIVESLERWKFSPALKHGEPQRVWVTVEYESPAQ